MSSHTGIPPAPINRQSLAGGSLRPGVGTGTGMDVDTIGAISGFVGLGVTTLTGALWDSPLATALFRLRNNIGSQGRRAMAR
jgi:hypothetical protein